MAEIPLSLKRAWKMSCSMMYSVKSRSDKRIFSKVLLLLVIAVMFFLIMPYGAQAADIEAEFLIVTSTAVRNTEEEINELKKTLTYMAKSYYTVDSEYSGTLDKFSYIMVITEESDKLDERLQKRIIDSEKPVIVLGQGALTQLSPNTKELTGEVLIRYSFSEDDVIQWDAGMESIYVINKYDKVIGGEIINGDEVYPYCVTSENITSIPLFSIEADTSSAAVSDMVTEITWQYMHEILSELIRDWIWPYQNSPWSYSSYLVLNDVYPFYDLEKLMEITEVMINESVNYAISVTPIYDNGHFPSVKRFCEYLRYAQSKGAAILLRVPFANITDINTTEVKERMELAYDVYTQYGVYPLGFTAPSSYMFSEEGLEVLRQSRTVFLFESDEEYEIPDSNMSFADGHTIIAQAYTADETLYTNSYSTAVYLDIDQDIKDIKRQIISFRDSKNPLKSVWNLTNSLYIGVDYFLSVPGSAPQFNGEAVSLNYEAFTYEEEFDYGRGFVQYLTDQIESSNQLIMTVVVSSSVILVILIYIARRYMKRQFLRKADKKPSRGEDV